MHKLFGLSKQPALHKAVQSGEISDVRVMLQKCTDIDQADKVSFSRLPSNSSSNLQHALSAALCYVQRAALTARKQILIALTRVNPVQARLHARKSPAS